MAEVESKGNENSLPTLLMILGFPIGIILLSTFVFFTGIGAPDGTKNEGDLVHPARALRESNIAFSVPADQHKPLWTLVQIEAADCDQACVDNLTYSRQMHKALGRRTPGLRRQLWSSSKLYSGLAAEHPKLEQLTLPEATSIAALTKGLPAARYYLVDPQGFLMMTYSDKHDYKQMIKDLKFLLTQSGY